MAENSKYYTPEIEEFHVGFEFESNYVLFQYGNKGDDWCKYTLKKDKYWFWDAYHYDAVETEFRVKYLDKEDIESFGFKHVKQGDPYSYKAQILTLIQEDGFNTGKKFTITKYPTDPLLTLTVESYGSYGSEIYTIQLFIKNKSELKRLLKQLKVIITT